MNADEVAALDALRTYARTVQEYNAMIDAPTIDYSSSEYIDAANAMEAANDAVLAAAEPLLEPA
jgi:hypothetical protein